MIRRAKDGVRVLADGELKAKVAFEVAGASKPAIEKIEKAGGSIKLLAVAEQLPSNIYTIRRPGCMSLRALRSMVLSI